MPDLEQLIRRRQDELRGRPQTRWEIFYDDHVEHIDWGFVAFTVCLVIATACYEFTLIAPLMVRP